MESTSNRIEKNIKWKYYNIKKLINWISIKIRLSIKWKFYDKKKFIKGLIIIK